MRLQVQIWFEYLCKLTRASRCSRSTQCQAPEQEELHYDKTNHSPKPAHPHWIITLAKPAHRHWGITIENSTPSLENYTGETAHLHWGITVPHTPTGELQWRRHSGPKIQQAQWLTITTLAYELAPLIMAQLGQKFNKPNG